MTYIKRNVCYLNWYETHKSSKLWLGRFSYFSTNRSQGKKTFSAHISAHIQTNTHSFFTAFIIFVNCVFASVLPNMFCFLQCLLTYCCCLFGLTCVIALCSFRNLAEGFLLLFMQTGKRHWRKEVFCQKLLNNSND